MFEPSDEQKIIIEHIKNGRNVVVDACAGAGKSSTILAACNELQDKKILQITFNSMLRKEIKEKINQMELKNITVHTFHSLSVRHYYQNAHTDTELRHILKQDMIPKTEIYPVDILVLDEAQDMTHLYLQIILKFIRDMLKNTDRKIQLFVLGDYMQGLYDFLGSDIRFLTLTDKIWCNHNYLSNTNFEKCELRTSYRITQQMADFVNRAMLGEERLLATKTGMSVYYIRRNNWDTSKVVYNKIMKLLEMGAKPQDFFVLSSSVKTQNIRKLENILSVQGIPCYVPPLERDEIDERVIDGKIVFSTFHSTKGRQRKYVFVAGFDNSYFMGKKTQEDKCPNTLYVACTRATQGLFLLESNQYATDMPLRFLKMTHYDMQNSPFVDFHGLPQSVFYKESDSSNDLQSKMTEKMHFTTPTKMIQFLNEKTMEIITPLLDKIISIIDSPKDLIEIPNVIHTKLGFYEDVSELTGICIPSMFYDIIANMDTDNKQHNTLLEIILQNLMNLKDNEHQYLRDIIQDLGYIDKMTEIGKYLYLSNIYIAIQEKIYYKLKQIGLEEYNWITEEAYNKCIDRLKEIIPQTNEKPKCEVTIIDTDTDNYQNIDLFLSKYFIAKEGNPIEKIRFTARVDLITEDTIWEIKTVSFITTEHMLQLVIYAWLWRLTNPNDKKMFKLINIKTGEIICLNTEMEDEINTIIVTILSNKYKEIDYKNDEVFLEECKNYFTHWE